MIAWFRFQHVNTFHFTTCETIGRIISHQILILESKVYGNSGALDRRDRRDRCCWSQLHRRSHWKRSVCPNSEDSIPGEECNAKQRHVLWSWTGGTAGSWWTSVPLNTKIDSIPNAATLGQWRFPAWTIRSIFGTWWTGSCGSWCTALKRPCGFMHISMFLGWGGEGWGSGLRTRHDLSCLESSQRILASTCSDENASRWTQ